MSTLHSNVLLQAMSGRRTYLLLLRTLKWSDGAMFACERLLWFLTVDVAQRNGVGNAGCADACARRSARMCFSSLQPNTRLM
jgi:hypothetical protein